MPDEFTSHMDFGPPLPATPLQVKGWDWAKQRMADVGLIETYTPAISTNNLVVRKRSGPALNVPPAFATGVPEVLLMQDGSINPLSQLLPQKQPIDFIMATDIPATIVVMDAKNSQIRYRTNKFILQSITKSKLEKYQIIETFGKSHLFFFDERTKIYAITGVLLDAFFGGAHPDLADKYMWAQAMQQFYDLHLRGTRLATMGRIAGLYVNNVFIKGYPLQLTISKESFNLPEGVQFQMTWAIKQELLLTQTDHLQRLYDPNLANKTSTTLQNEKQLLNQYFALLQTYSDARAQYDAVQKSKVAEQVGNVTVVTTTFTPEELSGAQYALNKAEHDITEFIKQNKIYIKQQPDVTRYSLLSPWD